jgi:exopolysaccharide production protein ExoY
MLIRLPRGSGDQPSSASEEGDAFEAGLRRDLASAPVISYDSVLGGWPKRAFDLAFTLLAAPIWVPLMLGLAAWSRLHYAAPVFIADQRLGYGNHTYNCRRLRLTPPTAMVTQLRPDADKPAADLTAATGAGEGPQAKWRRALERLPQFINVLAGEMSLVGPLPLSPQELEPLKMAKRYYLSARPGMIGVSGVFDAGAEPAGEYKLYALSWSLLTDMLVVWDKLCNLKDRGELWRPGALSRKPREGDPVVVRRRKGAKAD